MAFEQLAEAPLPVTSEVFQRFQWLLMIDKEIREDR